MMSTHTVHSQAVEAPPFINALEFCPFERASNLIAIASKDGLTIESCEFSVEKEANGGYAKQISKNLVHNNVILHKLRVCDLNCLAWSPVSNIKHLPNLIVIATGTKTGVINVYTADLKEEAVENSLEGHTDCVNHISFEPIEGQELASVSDDYSCKVWDVDSGDVIVSFPLQYPGVSVCWHPDQSGKLMAAELGGRIRFYNVHLKQAILSVDCKKHSLTSADWCWLNHSKVGASAEMEWFLWDITKSSYPLDSQQANSGGCRKLLWSKHHEDVFLTLGQPQNTVKIYHLGHRQPILHKVHETSMCASWHSTLPICAIAGNKAIHFYDTKSCTQF
uniref:nucleoporin Nup37-like n=1 Tax=Styela clava TaxID=7725 RepID=UPI00193A7033|nr:nucleoporin Nup37-like [Styela clava]